MQNNRLNINGKLVTYNQNLREINESIHEKEAFKHLCVTGPASKYEITNSKI